MLAGAVPNPRRDEARQRASLRPRRNLAGTDRFAARVFNLAVIALLGYLLLRIFQPFYAPILWAFLLAFLLFPLNERLRRRLKGRRGLAAAILSVAVMLGIAVPVVIGSVAFAKQAVELAQKLGEYAQSHQIAGFEDVLRLPLIGTVMAWLEAHAGVTSAQVQEWMADAAQSAVQFLLVRGRTVLFGALALVGDLTLTLFVFFFFLRDGDTMAARAKRLIPLEEKRKASLDRHLQDVTHAVVFGTVVTALVQGTLIGIAFWITGLRSPLVFGVLATVASFIPFVGTGLIWLPAAIVLFSQGVLWKAIFMAAWGALVAGSADNFLRPALVSGKAEMGTLTVFFGALGGLAAFGFAGLFLGPVILALALALIEFAEEAPPGPAATS
ncbi:MAG TPA: AI-2E family transporter [Thermoanaerobaculia bacterium]